MRQAMDLGAYTVQYRNSLVCGAESLGRGVCGALLRIAWDLQAARGRGVGLGVGGLWW